MKILTLYPSGFVTPNLAMKVRTRGTKFLYLVWLFLSHIDWMRLEKIVIFLFVWNLKPALKR